MPGPTVRRCAGDQRGQGPHGPRTLYSLADSVRRKPYVEALALLDALPHKGAKILRKVVKSAADNALVQNENLDEEALYVSHVEVNDAPRMKRIWMRGRGRADRLLKRMCHIVVAVAEVNEGEE